MQTFLDADLPAYAQPEAPVAYAQPDAHADAQPETPAYSFTYAESTDVETSYAATYARADTQPEQPAHTPAATQPEEPIYTPAYEQSYVQTATPAFVEPDVPVYADAQPEVPVYEEAQADAPVYAEVQPYVPVYTDAQADASSDEQPDHPWYYAKQADAVVGRQDEVVDLASGAEYDETPTGDESVSTLELEQEEDIDLSQELAELETEEPADTSDEELFDGEPVGVYTMPSAIDEPEIVVAAATLHGAPEATMDREFFADSTVDQEFFAESSVEPAFDEETLDEPMVVAEAIAAQAGDADAAAEWDDVDAGFAQPEPADAEFWMAASLTPRRAWPIIEGVPTESPIPASAPIEAAEATAPPRSARVPALTEPRPAPAPAPAVADPRSAPAPAPHKRDRPEWGELVASLRKDIERRRVDPPHEKPKPTATAPVPVQRRSKKAKPIQDEWGFFDPEQCGFAALLAKLDEITEGAEEPEVRQPS
jgi:hypothetical protein